jgi:hypothetical protein
MRRTLAELEYRRAMSSRVTVRFEHYDVHYHTWTEMEASPMECGGILLRAHDITELKRAQARLSNELQVISELQVLNARLLGMSGLEPALKEALSGCTAILGAAMGTMHLCKADTQTLEIVMQQGLSDDEFLAHSRSLKCDDSTPA